MDNTKLLQDITYYTRIIRERTKQNEKYAQINTIYNQNTNWKTIPTTKNKYNCYKYVNNTTNTLKKGLLIQPINTKTMVQPNTILIPPQNKVLINPRFKQTPLNNPKVHINPNFNTNRSKTVHVNRLTLLGDQILKEQNYKQTLTNQLVPHNCNQAYIIKQPSSKILINHSPLNVQSGNSGSSSGIDQLLQITSTQNDAVQQLSLKVHHHIEQKSSTVINQLVNINKQIISNNTTTKCFKSKYKLDRRRHSNTSTSTPRKRKYSYCTLTSTSMKRTTKVKSIRSHVTVNRNTNLINISGNLYKISRNKLQKTTNITGNSNSSTGSGNKLIKRKKNYRYVKQTEVKKNTSFGTISGGVSSTVLSVKRRKSIKLVTTVQQQKLRRISGRISSKYKLINTTLRNKTRTPKKLLRTTANKYRKNNVPCPIFNRYGKCSSHDKGTCRRVHDHKLISICKKYLQGACDIKSCKLSHNVTLEKMPTCKFYLDGFCSKDQCPYLHVKLNEKTDICRDFLNGFCQAADKCDKRHINYCPEFERSGKCSKTKCPYPHKTTANNINVGNKRVDAKETDNQAIISGDKFDDVPQVLSSTFHIDVDRQSVNLEDNGVNTIVVDDKIFRYYINENDNVDSVSAAIDDGIETNHSNDTASSGHEKLNHLETPDFIPFS